MDVVGVRWGTVGEIDADVAESKSNGDGDDVRSAGDEGHRWKAAKGPRTQRGSHNLTPDCQDSASES